MLPTIVLEVIILGTLGTLIGTNLKLFNQLNARHEEDIKRLDHTCNTFTGRMIKVETKLDIYLAHAGFDVVKVNRSIKEHLDDLEVKDTPGVGGCINISELYKD